MVGGDRGGFVVIACCYCDGCVFGLSWLDETEREDEDEEEKSADLSDDCHFDELGVVLVLCQLFLVDGGTEIW